MSGIIVVRLEMWKMKVTGIQTDGGDLSVYVYWGEGAANPSVTDVNQTENIAIY